MFIYTYCTWHQLDDLAYVNAAMSSPELQPRYSRYEISESELLHL